MNLGAGDLRWRAVISTPPVTKLPSGQLDPSAWVTGSTLRCHVVVAGGAGVSVAKGQQSTTSHTVTFRQTDAVQAGYKLTLEGRPFGGVVVKVTATRDDLGWTIAECVET